VVLSIVAIREFLRTPAGRASSIALVVFALGACGWSIWRNVRTDPTIASYESPLFIDAENGKTFHATLKTGMSIPVVSPYSGKATGYEAELCYWTKDGQAKTDPTPVLLNEYIGKPGPTFCPDCGRLVVHNNPQPGDRRYPGPPPTEAEWKTRHGMN
jgi:hypothetical protein